MSAPAQQTHRLLSAANSANATSVSTQSSILRRITGYNAKASVVYLKLYSQRAAATPAETDTPRKTIYLPATTAFDLECNDLFGSGIAYRLVTDNADNGTTAVAAGDILGLNIDYI